MTSKSQALGHWGEDTAVEYLKKNGYEIIARNIRTPHGEIDLLARQADQLVFVEVKARTSEEYGNPEEAITANKQTHMIESAQYYLQENALDLEYRIDVIAIKRKTGNQSPEITHFENALI